MNMYTREDTDTSLGPSRGVRDA